MKERYYDRFKTSTMVTMETQKASCAEVLVKLSGTRIIRILEKEKHGF